MKLTSQNSCLRWQCSRTCSQDLFVSTCVCDCTHECTNNVRYCFPSCFPSKRCSRRCRGYNTPWNNVMATARLLCISGVSESLSIICISIHQVCFAFPCQSPAQRMRYTTLAVFYVKFCEDSCFSRPGQSRTFDPRQSGRRRGRTLISLGAWPGDQHSITWSTNPSA